MYSHADLRAGCCVRAQLYLSERVGLGCRCAMSVRTSRGSCSSSASRTAKTGGLLEGGGARD